KAPQLLVSGVRALICADVQRVTVGIGDEAAIPGLERAGVGSVQAQQRPGPEVRGVATPEVVHLGALDGVVLALVMGDCEAEGDALLIQRSRLLGGMRLLVLG